jgi:hypothetical protein
MSLKDAEKEVQNLSPEELHEFSRWLTGYVATLPGDAAQKAAIGEGVRRMEAIIEGHTPGTTKSSSARP